jgi:hypothetical protein
MEYNQAQDVITQAIGVMSVEDKPSLIALLKKNGSLIADSSSQKQVLDATFKLIQDSPKFRNDLVQYLSSVAQDGKMSSFTADDGTFYNQDGTRVGNFLRTVFSQENISKAMGIGMDYLGASLQAKAQKGSNQQAIDYEVAKAQASAAEAARLQAQSLLGQQAPTTSGTPKWVLPVAIGGGVLVVGIVLYFALRKK